MRGRAHHIVFGIQYVSQACVAIRQRFSNSFCSAAQHVYSYTRAILYPSTEYLINRDAFAKEKPHCFSNQNQVIGHLNPKAYRFSHKIHKTD